MLHEEELQKEEELEKERYAQYLAEEKIIHDSLMSNDVELNRTMRYFSGVILILLTAYINWDIDHKIWIMSISYVPFIISICTNIISYMFVRSALYKQREFNEEYYLYNMEESLTKRSIAHRIGGILIWCSIISFTSGVLIIAILMVLDILGIKGGESNGA